MSINNTMEKNIEKIKSSLHYDQGISKSRLAHVTGLHFYNVEDILNYLKNENKVEEKKGEWRLKK